MPFFERDGLKLHYRAEGRGPPLLLLHGFPLSSEAWSAQLSALSGTHRVLAPDLRGFGASEGGGEVSMETYAEDAFALLDHEGIYGATVGGLSMGGYVALSMLRHDASRISALCLFDTTAEADDPAKRQGRDETAAKVRAEGIEVLVQAMVQKLLADPSAPLAAELRAVMRKTAPEAAVAALLAMRDRHDCRELLARYFGPLLVVVGEKDAVTPVATAQAMAALVAGSTLEVIPGVGHLPNQEAPEVFNARVAAFLAARAG